MHKKRIKRAIGMALSLLHSALNLSKALVEFGFADNSFI